jgi:hypothetical protein
MAKTPPASLLRKPFVGLETDDPFLTMEANQMARTDDLQHI